MKIIGCYDSEIFIESSVKSLYIVGCGNCNIYVASCERIAFVDKCEKLSLTIASNLLRICNTLDSTIYSYSPSPIILTGDNRSLILGPNNSNSKELKAHLKAGCLTINNENMYQFKNVIYKSETKSFDIMKPSEFDALVLPNKPEEVKPDNKNTNIYLLAPEEYTK